ncbi:MAG: hypothetical protein A3A86_02130 [Elusimicrobia bacterium RIFCSPLOWO2_01_FULL_60_11]|nr:MAG: hypothetical protein A3A86_02130 [Elusimicrobia bacterium RIFCSPLOWO2_01_FULL_60_11]
MARGKVPDMRLVLVGKSFKGDDSLAFASELGVAVVGEVNRPQLIERYRSARIFVFPSLYEGFGLPPLEAMACGTPVVCSNAASLPEVTGDAAVPFDPNDPGELASILEELWNSAQMRGELSKKGLERVKLFSWKTCADGIQKAYAEAV